MIQIVSFTSTLTHPSEYRHTAMRFCNVVDELHDENGFAYAGAAEQTDLATLSVWREQVDHLDARYENL